jgi:hypothetical protein
LIATSAAGGPLRWIVDIDISIVVDVDVPVDVDVDVAIALAVIDSTPIPIAVVSPNGSHRDPYAEGDQWRVWIIYVARRRVVNRIRVGRHINHLRVHRLNLDDGVGDHHHLLLDRLFHHHIGNHHDLLG